MATDDSWRRFTTDEEAAAALPEPSLTDPVSVGIMFVTALEDPIGRRRDLELLITPESANAWGDFTEAAAGLATIEDQGFGSIADEAVGALDVRYFKILRGVPDGYKVLDDQIIDAAAIVTLVWRPEFGQWMVHAMGDYVRPEHVPRTA